MNYTDPPDVIKGVTVSNYHSINPKGTITFSNGTMTGNGLSYALEGVLYYKEYTNGALTDTLSQPFNYPTLNASSSAQYKTVGSDSLVYTGGTTIGNNTVSGSRFSISGTKLILTSSIAKDTSFVDSGIVQKMHETADVKMYFHK